MSNTTTTCTDKPFLSSSDIIINPTSTDNNGGDHGTSTTKAANLSKWLFQDIDFIEESLEAVKRKADEMLAEVQEERKKLEKLDEDGTEAAGRDTQLKEVKKKVSKLRLAIPFKFITPPQPHYPNVNWRPRRDPSHIREITPGDLILQDHSEKHLSSTTSLSQEGEYPSVVTHNLEPFQACFLLCFLQFPPNAVIKRSILFGWVTASQFSHLQHFSAVEKFYETIDDLIAKGFIEAVQKKCSLTVAGYRMNHSTHHSLTHSTRLSLYQAIKHQLCLAPMEEEDYDVFYTGSSSRGRLTGHEYLEILHLGKWNKSSNQHIEFIDNPDVFFEKDVAGLSRLRYISLRGISMIQELPGFVTNIKTLQYLDVQACYNLEVIPSDIANLRHTLRHLDMSECYFLEHMPKELATLYSLEVLKGFFVGELVDETTCILEDLLSLPRLVKLNIYTSVKDFPNTSELTVLQKFESLMSLTISWGGCKLSPEDKYQSIDTSAGARAKYSFNLEKLDLQCVPKTVSSRGWLNPTNFKKLKRLYIRGGEFSDLGQWLYFLGRNQSDERETSCWNVEILRLKHLAKLKHLYWNILLQLFPKVILVEYLDCPGLFLFPEDDDDYIWTKDKEMSIYSKKNLIRV